MPASCPPLSHFGSTFSNMNHPILVTGQESNSHEAGADIEIGADIEAGADIGPGPIVIDGAFQAQPNNIQDSSDSLLGFGSNGYRYGSSGFLQPSLPVLGEPSGARTSARPHVAIKMVSPGALDERPIEHRRDVQLKLEIEISAYAEPSPFDVDPPEYCIRVSRTQSVKRSGSLLERTVLDLMLGVVGATTDIDLMFACHKCSVRESPSSQFLPMVDFVSREDLISVQQGKASIAFRFLCLPGHHGTADEEYKLSAMILEGDQVLEQHTFPNWIRVVSNSRKKRNAPPIPQGIETSTVMNPPFNSTDQGDISNPHAFGNSSSGTSAGEDQRSIRMQSLTSPAQSPTVDVSASVPPVNRESELVGQQDSLQSSAGPVNEHVAEADPELSRVNPRRGPTSGGDEIDLIVSNLPPTMKLYARFGCNITPTVHIAPGVLLCLLPPAAHPGVVKVTLCQAPSTSAEPYGRSLATFEYEADSARAVSLLLKLFNGKLLLEYMPLIQRLLQRDAGSPSGEAEPGPLDSNMSLRSSLPESAFLDILSALQPLPEFPRLLATVNEQGQTLLHLAIHLRYRQLFRKLVQWGIDLNVRDVNGFTALHVGYLCDDPLVIYCLEAEGATPFVLDELGRPPTELAASISGADGIATGKDREMVPLAVGYTNRSKEQRRLPGRAIPAATQETAFGPATEKVHPSKTLSAVNSGELFHGRNPAATTHTAPQATNGQLDNQPSLAVSPQLFHSSPPAINADREQPLIPTQSNMALPLSERTAHSPMPSTSQGAGAHVRLHPRKLDELSRASQLATSSTALPQIRGSPNDQISINQHGQSLQNPPHTVHQVTHGQGVEIYLAWQRLSSDRRQWDPDALEPNRPDGESILMNFTLRVDNKLHCRVPTQGGCCNYPNVKKERLLHHMRKDHLNFFPFVCGGSCRSRSCTQRFASEKARSEHITPRKIDCPICGKELYSQNYSSHYARCSQR